MTTVLQNMVIKYINNIYEMLKDCQVKRAQHALKCVRQLVDGHSHPVTIIIHMARLHFLLQNVRETRQYLVRIAVMVNEQLFERSHDLTLQYAQKLIYRDMFTIFGHRMYHKEYFCCKYCYLSSVFFFDLNQTEISFRLSDLCQNTINPVELFK